MIPVNLSKRVRVQVDQNWGFKSKEGFETIDLPPRLMWFDSDWTLAKCHRVILGAFFFILLGDLQGEPVPTYEQVFGLSSPLDEMR